MSNVQKTQEKLFTEINTGPLISEEVDIDQPELENKYKVGDREIIVLTGKNPKCPPGYEIIRTDINEKNSDTNVIICAKNISPAWIKEQAQTTKNFSDLKSPCLDTFGKPNHCARPGLDWQDINTLTISDNDYNNLRFPFIQRDDAFSPKPPVGSAEIWYFILLVIIVLLYVINNKINKNNVQTTESGLKSAAD